MPTAKRGVREGRSGPPIILGWREWVGLPDLGVGAIRAKLDTGARSSALHVDTIKPFKRSGIDWVKFTILQDSRVRRPSIAARARVLDERMVRDSGGHEHLRVVIRTTLDVAGRRWPIDLTLASRAPMSFRMLLGRQGLSGRVVLDPAHSYLAGRPASLRRK
jgi:hypothetical protein